MGGSISWILPGLRGFCVGHIEVLSPLEVHASNGLASGFCFSLGLIQVLHTWRSREQAGFLGSSIGFLYVFCASILSCPGTAMLVPSVVKSQF